MESLQGSQYILEMSTRGKKLFFSMLLILKERKLWIKCPVSLDRFSRFSRNVSLLQLSVTQREGTSVTILYVTASTGLYGTQNQRSLKNKPRTSSTLPPTFNFLHTSGGLWALAREIQTNDMSIRIRFDFLVSPSALGFFLVLDLALTLWDFFLFWILGVTTSQKILLFWILGWVRPTRTNHERFARGSQSFCQEESVSRGIFLDKCCTNVTKGQFNG